MYKKMPDKKSVFFDVDNTLVFSLREYPHEITSKVVKINGRKFWVHSPHVEIVKDFKARGHNVVVWSAGGADWAEMVVNALELEKDVDLIISKPDWYFDDKPAHEWMPDAARYYKDRYEGGKL